MTADRSLRQAVADLMVDVHLIPRELAAFHVSEMDDFEVAGRFSLYTGLELSADRRKTQSDSDFYQVFGIATATARCSALNCEPVPNRRALPELEERTWSDGGVGR